MIQFPVHISDVIVVRFFLYSGSFFAHSRLSFFFLLLYLILHNFDACTLSWNTIQADWMCSHQRYMWGIMYVYTRPFLHSLPHFFFFFSSSFFINLPAWFRSSLFRARATKKKEKNERNIILIPVITYRYILFLFSVSAVLIQVRTKWSSIRLFFSLSLSLSPNWVHQYIMMWRDRTRMLNLVT